MEREKITNRQILGTIDMNCHPSPSLSSSLDMKSFQIPKLVKRGEKKRTDNQIQGQPEPQLELETHMIQTEIQEQLLPLQENQDQIRPQLEATESKALDSRDEVQDLWRDLKVIIEKNIFSQEEKSKALSIIQILRGDESLDENKDSIPLLVDGNTLLEPESLSEGLPLAPLISTKASRVKAGRKPRETKPPQIEINYLLTTATTNSTLPIEVSAESTLDNPIKQLVNEFILDDIPLDTDRAKRRLRRASLSTTTVESPPKIRKNRSGSRQIKVETSELAHTDEQSSNDPFEDEFAGIGVLQWNAENSPLKSNTMTPEDLLKENLNSCEEKITQLSLTSSTENETDENFGDSAGNFTLDQFESKSKTGNRRSRRQSVSASRIQSKCKDEKKFPKKTGQCHREEETVTESANLITVTEDPMDVLQSNNDENSIPLLAQVDSLSSVDSISTVISQPELESASSIRSEPLQQETARIKRRPRRVSLANDFESPKKVRKGRAQTPKAKPLSDEQFSSQSTECEEILNPSPNSVFATPPRSQSRAVDLDAGCMDNTLFNLLMEEYRVEFGERNIEISLELFDTAHHLMQRIFLSHHVEGTLEESSFISSPAYSVILIGLAPLLSQPSLKESLKSYLHLFIPLVSALVSLTENQSSRQVADSRKIQFVDCLGTCVSPPNDRIPGSGQSFQLVAKYLVDALTSIEQLLQEKSRDSKLSNLLTQFCSNLMMVIQNPDQLRHLSPGTEPPPSLIEFSKIILGEIGTHFLSDSSVSLNANSNQLYLPNYLPIVHQRTTLRHRTTWAIVSVIRYHLRWLIDEPPLRAERIQLLGLSPTHSARSLLSQTISIVPAQPTTSRDTAKTEPFDISPSSAFTLALQQLFNGLNEFSLPQQMNRKVESLYDLSDEMLFRELESCFNLFQDHLMQTIETMNEIELLHFAQTALAAERGRQFIQDVLFNSSVNSIGESSGTWTKIEEFSLDLLRHGLPEDYHLSLLSNISRLRSLVSSPLISSEYSCLFERIVYQKVGGRGKGNTLERAELKEMIELCPFLFNFPTLHCHQIG